MRSILIKNFKIFSDNHFNFLVDLFDSNTNTINAQNSEIINVGGEKVLCAGFKNAFLTLATNPPNPGSITHSFV
jgi:hypothetical protein